MITEILKYLPVYLGSMLKFVVGPATGYAVGLTVFETILFTVLGMMTSVFIFSFLGDVIRKKILSRFLKDKKKFTPRNRRFIFIWKRYGIFGISFLTPLLLTPIGGTLLATTLGSPRGKLLVYMFFSAVFWSSTFSFILHYVF